MFKAKILLITIIMMAGSSWAELTREEMIQADVDAGNIELYTNELGRTEKKTADQVVAEAYCLGDAGHAEYQDFIDSFGSDFKTHIMSYLHDSIKENKKYYLHMQDGRRLVYFRQGTTYFLQLVSIDNNGDENIIARYFNDANLGSCIKVLPESCMWNGSQTITYETKCRAGSNVGKNLIQDFIELSTTATTDEVSFEELFNAFKECYQPACYNIPFSCMKHELAYDHEQILAQLQGIADGINNNPDYKLGAYVERNTLTLKYSGTDFSLVRPPAGGR